MGVREVSSFYGGIVKQRVGENSNTYIVDSHGRVIYHQNSTQIGTDISTSHVVQIALAGGSGAVRTTETDGKEIVAGYAPIPGTPWFLVSEENWVSLASAFQGYRQFLILLLVLGILIPIFLVNIGSTRIMHPIEALIGAAKEVARGNFDQAISANTGDEIEELANQFNLMAEQLRTSYAQLEQRVSDRTKELTVLYRADEELLSYLQLDDLLKALVNVAVDIIKTDKSALLVWNAERTRMVMGATRGFSPETLGPAAKSGTKLSSSAAALMPPTANPAARSRNSRREMSP